MQRAFWTLWCILIIASHSSFCANPELYHQYSEQQYLLANEILQKVELKGNEAILDVGCGDGKITHEIAQRVPRGSIMGIDPCVEMFQYALQYYSRENLTFANIKAEDLKDTETYDLIFSFSAFLWIKEPQKAFSRVSKALKPGGKLIIVTPPKGSCDWGYYEKALEDVRWSTFKPLSSWKTMLSAHEYLELAEAESLRTLYFKTHRYHYNLGSMQDFKMYVKGWLFCYVPLPSEYVESYLDVLAEQAEKEFVKLPNGSFDIPYDATVMIFQKLSSEK